MNQSIINLSNAIERVARQTFPTAPDETFSFEVILCDSGFTLLLIQPNAPTLVYDAEINEEDYIIYFTEVLPLAS